MKANEQKLTAERLRELLDYDHETGIFRTKNDRIRSKAGTVIGTPHESGYILIGVDRTTYRAHRLAWLHYYGEWPPTGVDHRDLNRSNNRIKNLRLANQQQNMANIGPKSSNTSGFKGIHKHHRKWCAQISVGGRRRHLGLFSTPEEANAAYLKAAQEEFGEYARAA